MTVSILNPSQRAFLKKLSIGYIIIRLLADLSLLHPEARELAISWGWPINDFWAYTIVTVVLLMLGLAIFRLVKGSFDGTTTYIFFTLPVLWAIVLIVFGMDLNVPTMIYDALSWLIFSIAVLRYSTT